MKALVLGAGVIGLSVAWELRDAGYDVEIWAKDFPPNTTSNVAGAIWYPYKANPENKVREWGLKTLERMIALTKDPESGVRLVSGKKFYYRPVGQPWWKAHVSGFRTLGTKELIEATHSGYHMELPLAEMDLYLNYLIASLRKQGVKFEKREVSSLEETRAFSPVVNCLGLGARDVVKDEALFPIRGQVVRVEATVKDFFMETDHPTGMIYVFPRSRDVVLGGTADDNTWDLNPSEKTTQEILERAQAVCPELKAAKIRSVAVGLRPGRSSVRLEMEKVGDQVIIHNYGHGGSGMTLSWGCAEEVRELLAGLSS